MITKYLIGSCLVAASSLISMLMPKNTAYKEIALGGFLLAQSTSPDANDGPTCITGSALNCDHTTTGIFIAGLSGTSQTFFDDSDDVLTGQATGTGTTLYGE